LEDQLLSVIVKYERKELEEQRERLIQETRYLLGEGLACPSKNHIIIYHNC